METHIRTA